MKSAVAIVGRPNVGKSTLFNRLAGRRQAIVEDIPGTTRDLLTASVFWQGEEVTLIDSGGFELSPESSLKQKVKGQVERAIAEADILLFLVDAHDGLIAADQEIAEVLRCASKPIILIANKVDEPRHRSELWQFYQLGLGEPIPVSAYHNKGIEELEKAIIARLPSDNRPDRNQDATMKEIAGMKIAIVGRTNVGKSTLLNTLLGEERAIVDELPGTTRDAIDSIFHYNSDIIIFIDTAGLRRRGQIKPGLERHSVIRVGEAIKRADIALLVTDATEGITAQDTHILGEVKEAYKGVILIINKWDLAPVKDKSRWEKAIYQRLKFMPYVPIIFTSAISGEGVAEILPKAKMIYQERLKQLSAPLLNKMLKEAVEAQPPPRKGTQRLKFFRVAQTGVNPPSLVFWVNNAKLVHFSYQRYLENRLRQWFGFHGTPLYLQFKTKEESP
jgi:GTP-binding protein